MLGLRLGIEPGIETRAPEAAVDRYEIALKSIGETFEGKRILILGYGGFFGLAVSLLRRGASHIVLLDPFAKFKHQLNRNLARSSSPYLQLEGNRVIPDPGSISIFHKHVSEYLKGDPEKVELVLSSSVFEHIPDPLSETRGLKSLTNADGHHVHVIDLRDHYFKHPFEMLCYSKSTWARFLNPSSNLNRLRMWEYESIFRNCFDSVRVDVLEDDRDAFRRVKARIRPEFLSGDVEMDSASKIVVLASEPKP
jgi:hypothetical protein